MKKVILTILFILSLITFSYAAECPLGDAVIVSKKDKNDTNVVECVNWNIEKRNGKISLRIVKIKNYINSGTNNYIIFILLNNV